MAVCLLANSAQGGTGRGSPALLAFAVPAPGQQGTVLLAFAAIVISFFLLLFLLSWGFALLRAFRHHHQLVAHFRETASRHEESTRLQRRLVEVGEESLACQREILARPEEMISLLGQRMGARLGGAEEA